MVSEVGHQDSDHRDGGCGYNSDPSVQPCRYAWRWELTEGKDVAGLDEVADRGRLLTIIELPGEDSTCCDGRCERSDECASEEPAKSYPVSLQGVS